MPATSAPILVVDDDELGRDLLLLMLESEGHAAHAFPSGESILTALRSSAVPTPAAILTDLQMPGLTGNPLALDLRQHFASGNTTPGTLSIRATRAPADAIAAFDGFLLKPFTAAQLTQALAANSAPATPSAPQEASPNTTPTSETPDLNEATCAALAASMPPAQLSQLYAFSLSDTEARVARMRAAAAAGDAATYIREAHVIKGSCGLLGASRMHALAAVMESGGLPTLALLDQISAAAGHLQRILETRFTP